MVCPPHIRGSHRLLCQQTEQGNLLLLFMPPSPSTPYFSIQKLSLVSMTKGSLLRTFSKGRKLKSASSCPGRLKCSPTPVSKWFLMAPLCSVHLCLQGRVSPTFPTYCPGLLRQCPAPCEHVTLYTTESSSQVILCFIGQVCPVKVLV